MNKKYIYFNLCLNTRQESGEDARTRKGWRAKGGGSGPKSISYCVFEMKKEDSLKPYDAKKSVWVPDGEGGFDEAMIEEIDGDKVTVKVGWEPKTFKTSQIMQVNPPKMEKFDDVSNMTYLNEASVLWNLKARYVAKLIYVS